MAKEVKVVNNREDIKKYYGDLLMNYNWFISKQPIENENVRCNIFSFEDKAYIVVTTETLDEFNNKRENRGNK